MCLLYHSAHKEQNRAEFGTEKTRATHCTLCYRLTAGWTDGRDSCSRISDPMKYQTTSHPRQL